MNKRKIKNLIRDIEKCKNLPAFMLNRALDEEEIKWMYQHTKPKHAEGWFEEDGKMIYYGPNGEKYS